MKLSKNKRDARNQYLTLCREVRVQFTRERRSKEKVFSVLTRLKRQDPDPDEGEKNISRPEDIPFREDTAAAAVAAVAAAAAARW